MQLNKIVKSSSRYRNLGKAEEKIEIGEGKSRAPRKIEKALDKKTVREKGRKSRQAKLRDSGSSITLVSHPSLSSSSLLYATFSVLLVF